MYLWGSLANATGSSILLLLEDYPFHPGTCYRTHSQELHTDMLDAKLGHSKGCSYHRPWSGSKPRHAGREQQNHFGVVEKKTVGASQGSLVHIAFCEKGSVSDTDPLHRATAYCQLLAFPQWLQHRHRGYCCCPK
jgi:hypothetical protein